MIVKVDKRIESSNWKEHKVEAEQEENHLRNKILKTFF